MQESFSIKTIEQAKLISQKLSLLERKSYSFSELSKLLIPLPYGRNLISILNKRKCITKVNKTYTFPNNEPINYKLIAAELTLLKNNLKEYQRNKNKKSEMSESDMILHLKNLGYKIYKQVIDFKEI